MLIQGLENFKGLPLWFLCLGLLKICLGLCLGLLKEKNLFVAVVPKSNAVKTTKPAPICEF